jgi:hypothetical protein
MTSKQITLDVLTIYALAKNLADLINTTGVEGVGIEALRDYVTCREVLDALQAKPTEYAEFDKNTNKVEQVKALRMLTGWGLKDSLDYINQNGDKFPVDIVNPGYASDYQAQYGDTFIEIKYAGQTFSSALAFARAVGLDRQVN